MYLGGHNKIYIWGSMDVSDKRLQRLGQSQWERSWMETFLGKSLDSSALETSCGAGRLKNQKPSQRINPMGNVLWVS